MSFLRAASQNSKTVLPGMKSALLIVYQVLGANERHFRWLLKNESVSTLKLDPKYGKSMAVRDYFGAIWFRTLLYPPFQETNVSQHPVFIWD